MGRYKLLLDESGNFDSLIERYIIIGGLFFCEDDQEQLEKIFIPLHQHLCEVSKSCRRNIKRRFKWDITSSYNWRNRRWYILL